MTTSQELMKKGGAWLGAAREWIKWHCLNGSNVTWGSEEQLNPPLSVKNVEEIAAKVAAALLNHDVDLIEERRNVLKYNPERPNWLNGFALPRSQYVLTRAQALEVLGYLDCADIDRDNARKKIEKLEKELDAMRPKVNIDPKMLTAGTCGIGALPLNNPEE